MIFVPKDKIITPLEILNRYYTVDGAFVNRRGTLWHRMNGLLSWANIVNNGYQAELRPLLYDIITKRLPDIDTARIADREERETIPHSLLDILKNDYLQNLKRNMILLGAWESLKNELISNDIKFVALKGAHLAENVYEHIACRPMTDVDILVREEDIERCRRILNSRNFVRCADERRRKAIHDNYLQAGPHGEISIELHHHLTNPLYGARFDLECLWGETYLPLEYNLVYLSWHAVRHSFLKLIWLCDCAALIKKYHADVNWEEVARKSVLFNAGKQVRLCLHLVGALLSGRVSGGFPRSLRETIASRIGERILFKVQNTLARQRDPALFTKVLAIHTMERKTLFKFPFAYVRQ